ncbi:unnamed protein product [Arctogadus glacialis]
MFRLCAINRVFEDVHSAALSLCQRSTVSLPLEVAGSIPSPLDDPSGGAWEVLPLVDLAVEAGVTLGMLGVSPYVGVSSSDAGLRACWLSFALSEAISPPGAPAEYPTAGEPQNTDLRLGDQSLQRPSGPPAGSNTAGPAGTHPPHPPHSPAGPAEHTQELWAR